MDAANPDTDRVSRRRYERERRARAEAERLLEEKSRELWALNEKLRNQAAHLEDAVRERTADLELAKKQAEHANAAKSAFLAMISHDIRTPLNGVLGMAQVLSHTNLSEDQTQMTDLIMSSGETLMNLLNDVLDLSKIEALQMEMESIPVDVVDLVRNVGQLFGHMAREKDLNLDIAVDVAAPSRLHTDPTRLRQILNNLLSNAVKFTDVGHVRLWAYAQDELLTIEVHDTGPGVALDRQESLFRAFSQTDVSIARRFGGSGLGLTISRELCRLMGGDLTYRPSPDGGACFQAVLRAPKAVETVDTSTGYDPSSPEGARAILAARPWRVLAAEDNRTNQKVLSLLLRPLTPDLTVVNNGLEAVEAFRAQAFDIVLLDINMPEMSGIDAVAAIRAYERSTGRHSVPIVALTANVMTHQIENYVLKGFDGHISKPIRRNDLAQCMARLLSSGNVSR